MRFAKTSACLVFAASIAASTNAWAQCSGGRPGGGGGRGSMASTNYSQVPLTNNYSQTPLNPYAYAQQALAMEQYLRTQQALMALQAQTRSMAMQVQAEETAARLKMSRSNAEKRKAAQQEKLAAQREERESAKLAKTGEVKNSEIERSSMRLTSVQ